MGKIRCRDWRPGHYKGADTAQAVFLCVKHRLTRIMVGCVGAEKSAPGSFVAGYANPAQFTTRDWRRSGD
ncbi:ash family protein [Klebsiella pneumoniae]|nr:ash family protein [Klebsiella pneumoniae]MBS8246087.1 ash family protein [Klebsiella pneumoniae]NNG29937.1 hypothetical protein [Klebsiella pneumoniae]